MKQANLAAVYQQHLCNAAWYTADPGTPYLVKAAANEEFGYQILITNLKETYYCAGDIETIKQEKKVTNQLNLPYAEVQSDDKD